MTNYHSDNGFNSLRNQLLIAMPGMSDDRFAHSVTYICDHNAQGAMGLIINQPTDMSLENLLEQLDLDIRATHNRYPVLHGGPVQPERGFVLHCNGSRWTHTVDVSDGIAITASRDILEAIAQGNGPDKALVILGYAGWSAGQLENEMADNAWLSAPATPDILFDTPFEQRARVAVFQLGVDLHLLPTRAGRA